MDHRRGEHVHPPTQIMHLDFSGIQCGAASTENNERGAVDDLAADHSTGNDFARLLAIMDNQPEGRPFLQFVENVVGYHKEDEGEPTVRKRPHKKKGPDPSEKRSFYQEHQFQFAKRGYAGTSRKPRAKTYGSASKRRRFLSVDFFNKHKSGKAGSLVNWTHKECRDENLGSSWLAATGVSASNVWERQECPLLAIRPRIQIHAPQGRPSSLRQKRKSSTC